MSGTTIDDYIKGRVAQQLDYFEKKAAVSQQNYARLKGTAIACNILTTMSIALAFTVPPPYQTYMGILSLVLSTVVLATYQWEEFKNYGSNWSKFRLVAEHLKSEIVMFRHGVGKYSVATPEERERRFIEAVEGLIQGTDLNYFSVMVEPGSRTETKIQNYVPGS